MKTFPLILLIVSLFTIRAQAWGPEGHIIVARIAEHHLSAPASKAVDELLSGTNHIADDSVANWPDQIRQEHPEYSPWHFVDIPVTAKSFQKDRDCGKAGCVLEALEKFRRILADPSQPREARVTALKFVVHFVGDLHQPLHCAERANDHGGNRCFVQWPGDAKPANLHAVWDFHLLVASLHEARQKPLAYADQLNRSITPEEISNWQKGSPTEWAWEGHELAISQVYPGIPADGTVIELPDAYIQSGRRTVDLQLQRAGVRLAGILNQIFP